MRGCFVKDLYTLLKYLPFYALYCLAFVLIAVFTKNTAFVTGLAVLLPVSVISAVVTADKKDGFTEYAFACGLSPLAVAAEKLILALGFAAFAVALWRSRPSPYPFRCRTSSARSAAGSSSAS